MPLRTSRPTLGVAAVAPIALLVIAAGAGLWGWRPGEIGRTAAVPLRIRNSQSPAAGSSTPPEQELSAELRAAQAEPEAVSRAGATGSASAFLPRIREREALAEPVAPGALRIHERSETRFTKETGFLVGRLTGMDLDGRRHRLGEDDRCRAVAVVFLSVDCPISNGSIPELNRIAGSAESTGFELYGVISDRATTRDAARRHHREFQLQFPVLFDASGALRDRLGPTHTPQVFVLDAAGRVRYRGRIDDRNPGLSQRAVKPGRTYLRDALEAVIAGRAPEVVSTEPVGCLLETDAAVDGPVDVTYCRDIAPIVQAHCASCHRPGEVAPFPLLTYADVSRRAGQIRLVTESRVMPPWKPVHGFGRFRDERRLGAREIALIAQWAAAGAPEGNPADLPPPPQFVLGWQLGQPDLVLQLPEAFEVPAAGSDIYQYFALPTGLTEDRMVTAIEFRPSNPRVVHHAGFAYDVTGTGRRLDDAEPGPGYRRFGGAGFRPTGALGGWGPGTTPRHLPRGLGRRLAKGADLMLQVHYHPTGKPERDRPRIGLHFADEPVTQEIAEILVANYDLRIPAGAADFVHRASYTLPVDVTLHAVAPHMHLLGREVRATATRPDGRAEPLIRIDQWDFNWQDQYQYARPLRLPGGTRIDVVCRYDNTAANPFNPHAPPRDVRWGEGSSDEMGILFLDVTTGQAADLHWLRQHNGAYLDRQIEQNPWLLEGQGG